MGGFFRPFSQAIKKAAFEKGLPFFVFVEASGDQAATAA